jgi:hypothetical protein
MRQIHAHWDPDALVWVAESDDVPGLATEASTEDGLKAKLQVLVPELLELNCGIKPSEAPEYEIHWHRAERVRLYA